MTSMLLVELSLAGFSTISYQPSRKSKPIIDFGYNVKKVYNSSKLKKTLFSRPKRINSKKIPKYDATYQIAKLINDAI